MMNADLCKAFSKVILKWSNKNPRELPWDVYNDPYKVWATEIMLQQTTVSQATNYIHRFFLAFPNLESLASASEEEVLKLWEGLGYYSRARNLHFTSRHINENLKGIFPSTYKDLLLLKGVGPYTAAAIASFCFEESVPVIDGNVIRVISRYFGLKEAVNENKTAKEIRSIAHDTLGKNNPALYNQAIMNFGAIQCKPRNPDCNSCPLKNSCIARNENAVSEIPYKSKKTIKRKRFFEYFIIHTKGKIYFGKREGKDIWKHLWQFPLIEVKSFQSKNSLEKLIKKNFGLGQYVFIPGLEEIKQQLTHQTIASKIHLILLDDQNYPKLDAYKKVEMSKISDFPTPKTINNFLSNNNLSLVIKKYAKYK